MESPSNREIAAPPAAATADRLAFAVGAGEGGERLDRFLSQAAAARGLALSRTRLKALIEAGQVTIDGAEARDPAARVAEGARIALAVPPAEEAAIAGEDIPLDDRVRGRASARHRQARRARRPSRARPRRRHAGQRADPPLRRQPVGHRRRQAAGHRPSARQGHVRACWSSPRPTRRTSGLADAVRRPRPQRARWGANICALVWGALRRARRERSTRRSAAIRVSREKMAVVADERGRRGGHPLARRGTARPGEPRRLPARDRAHPPDPRPPRPYRPSAARRFRLWRGLQDQGEPAVRRPARAALDALGRQALHAATLGFEHPDHRRARWLSKAPRPKIL